MIHVSGFQLTEMTFLFGPDSFRGSSGIFSTETFENTKTRQKKEMNECMILIECDMMGAMINLASGCCLTSVMLLLTGL